MFGVFTSRFLAALLAVTIPVPPVRGTVIDGFRAPTCIRCAGHRGVTIATTTQSPVRAVTGGVIVFVGQVARVLYIVQDIGDAAQITYGRLEDTRVTVRDRVAAGGIIGVSGPELYLGVRLNGQYVNPLRFLGFGGTRLVGTGGVIVAR